MFHQSAAAVARRPSFPLAVGQFMTWPAPQLSPETTAREAAELMSEYSTDHAVIAVRRNVSGLVCKLDLLELEPDEPLWWAMTPPAGVVVPSTSLDDASEMLFASGSCALVVDAGDQLGVLLRDDFAAIGLGRAMLCALCGTAHRVVETPSGEPAFCCECATLLVRRCDLERFVDDP